MEDSKEWLRQVKSGEDPQAYQRWVELKSSSIAAFAFQNGVPDEQSGKFQREVFDRFFERLFETDSQDAEAVLYQIASEIMPRFTEKLHESHNPKHFHFEEDEELHGVLQQVALPNRLALTLSYFHQKSPEELSAILSVDPEKLQTKLKAPFESLQKSLDLEEHQLDKRLILLAKSYNRMNLPKPDKENPADMPSETLQNEPPKRKSGKGLAGMLAAASLLIGVLIVSSFLLDTDSTDSEGTAEEITEKAEEWREQYEGIRNNSPELMGISPEIYEELPYVNAADRFAAGILSEENIEKMRDDPEGLENQFTRVLFYIQTPLGMVNLLENIPLSAEETDLFMYTFAEKTEQLMEVSNQLLQDYSAEFDNAILDGELSSVQLLANQGNYSEEPSNFLSGLAEQMLTPFPHPTEERFISRRELRPLYSTSGIMNDWTIASNLMMLEREPFFDDAGLTVQLDEAAHLLKELEHYLLDEHSRSMLYTGFNEKFQQLFWWVLKGNENESVFGADGTVKEEYRAAWNTVAESRNNPILYVLLPILEEMEQSGWTSSGQLDELSPQQISGVMNMERAEILAEAMPNGHMLREPEFIDITGFSYKDTEELYSQFVLEYDLLLLSGKSPAEVYFLYHFANREEDPETMWHLLHDDQAKPEKQEFLSRWQQIPDIAEAARWIEHNEDSFYRSRHDLLVQLSVNYSIEPDIYREGPVLITTENDVWLIKYQFSENYSAEQLKGEYLEQVLSLYEEQDWENASPAEIFGVILLAREQDDHETVEELVDEFFYQQENRDVLEAVDSMGLPLLEDMTALSFNTDIMEETGQDTMGSLTATTRDGAMINMFSLIKTEEGWKLIY